MRVLLTGGSGFIASHTLETLLKHGHSVVTTVRSQEKADKIKSAHPDATSSQLSFVIVPDISQPNAFAHAVQSDPPFEAVIHTASPFHFNIEDVQKDLLDPAINGTKGVLKAIQKSAQTVKRVVITSSFASITNPGKGSWPEHTYTEADWNPITEEEAVENPSNGYRASKTFAEKAAWDFIATEKPSFTIAVINPPFVFGPVVPYLGSLSAINTSNQRVRDITLGKWADLEEIPPTMTFLYVDVRDVALAHVRAIEPGYAEKAANKRFLCTAGKFCNKEVLDVLRKGLPELEKQGKLPPSSRKGGGFPEEGSYSVDTSRIRDLLGIQFMSLQQTICDTAKSLEGIKEE